jgi:hypothetical protein
MGPITLQTCYPMWSMVRFSVLQAENYPMENLRQDTLMIKKIGKLNNLKVFGST